MQTFFPYPDLSLSALSLDKRRAFKQVIEARQILDALTNPLSKSYRFRNHPAVKMYSGYTEFLKQYYNVFLDVCLNVHKINTKYEYLPTDNIIIPWWWNNDNFHNSHKARLLEKDYAFYSQSIGIEYLNFNNSKYWWPDNDTKTFKII